MKAPKPREIRDPEISIVLTTRNRGAQVLAALASILECRGPEIELLVVDQSDDQSYLAALPQDPRLRPLRSGTRGLSRGRNEGVAAARYELVAFTDDDCLVPPDWPAAAARGLGQDGRVAMLFGNVLPEVHHGQVVPGHVRSGRRRADFLWQKNRVEGMGACMALRRSVWQELGGFDPLLGAGAEFRAGEDLDLAIRSLSAGYSIVEDSDFWVRHQGGRSGPSLDELIGNYWTGTGAVFAKHLRCGRLSLVYVLTQLGLRFLFSQSPVSSSLGPAASREARLRAFVKGFLKGWKLPLEADGGLFQSNSRLGGVDFFTTREASPSAAPSQQQQ